MLTRRSRIMRGKIELHALLLIVIPSLLVAFSFLEASAFGSTRRNPPPRPNGPPPPQQQQQIRRQGLPHDSSPPQQQQNSPPPNSQQNPQIGHRRINNHHHHGPPPPPKHRGRPPFPFPRRRPPPPPPRGRGPPPPPRERENNDNRHNSRPPPHYNKPPPPQQNTNNNDPPPKLSFHIPPAPISSTNVPPPPLPPQLQEHHQRQPQPPHPTNSNAQASEPHVQVNFQHPGFQNQQQQFPQQQQFQNTNPSQQPHLMLNNHPQFPTFNPPPQPHLPHTAPPPPPTSQQPQQPFHNNNPFNQFQQAPSSQQPPQQQQQFNVLNPSQQPIQFNNNNNVPHQPFQQHNNVFNQFQNQQPQFNNNNQQPVFGQINPQSQPNQQIIEYAPPPNTFNAVTPHPLDNLDKSKELELNSIPKQTITFTVTPKPSKNGGTQLHFKISTPKPFKTTLKPITNSKGYFKGSTYRPPVDKLSTKFKYPPSNPGYPDAEYRVQDGSHHRDTMSAEMEPPNQNPESIKDVLTMNNDHQLNQPRQPHPDDTDTYAGPSYNSPPVFVKPGSGEHVLIAGMNSGKSAYHKGSSSHQQDDDLPPFRTNPYDEDYDNGPIVAHDHPPFEEEDIGSKSYSDRHLPYGPAKDNAFDNEEPPFRRPGSSSHSVEEGFDDFGEGQQQQRGKGKQRQQLHIHEESLSSGETKRGRPGHSKYSQPDPLYHPEEDRGSESKEQNNGGGEFTDMSPPGRFENFGSGFSSGENDAPPHKNQDYVPRSRGDADDNKDPQKNTAEELLAALGLSTNPLVSMPSNKYPVDVPTRYSLPGSWEKDYTETENKRKPGAGGEPMGLLEYLNQKKDEDGQPGNPQQQEHHATEPLYSVPDRQIGGSAENSFVVKGSMKTGGGRGPIEPIAKPSSNVVLGRPIPHFTGTEPDFPRSQQQQQQQSSYVDTKVKGHAHVSTTGQESYLYEKIHGPPAQQPHEHHHNHEASNGVPVINTGLYGPSVPPPISGPGTFTNSPPIVSSGPPVDSPVVHYIPQPAQQQQHPHLNQAHSPQIGTESYLFQKVHAAKPALAFGPTPPSPHSVEDVAALGVPGLYGTHLHAHPHTGLYASQSEQIAAASGQPAGQFPPQGNVNNGVLLPVGMGVQQQQQPQPQLIHHRVDQSGQPGVYSHPSPTPQQQQLQQQIIQQSASQMQQVQQQQPQQQVHHILHHVPQSPPSPPTNAYANGNTGNEPIDRIHQVAPLQPLHPTPQQQQQQQQQQYALPPGYVLAQQQPNGNQYNPQHIYVQQQQPDHSASGSSHQYVAQAPQNLYGAAVTPRYGEAYPVYVTEPDPIIEIIVQDSNMTLPAMPTLPPPPPPPPPTPEPVHVFYVKYSQKNNTPVFDSFYGPSEPHIQLEQPISSIPVRGPDRNGVAPDDGGQDQMPQSSIQTQTHNFNQLQQQEPSTTAAPQSPTTLRTVIRPDRNEFAHASTGLVVSFDQPAIEHEIFANYTQNLSNQQQAILQQQQNDQAAILQQQQQVQLQQQQQQSLYQQQQQKAQVYPDMNYPEQYAQYSHQEVQQPAYPNLESLWPGITDQQQKQMQEQQQQSEQQAAAVFQQQGFGKRIGLQELASLLETSPSGDQQQQPQRDDGQAYQDEQNNPPPLYQYVENNHHQQQAHHQQQHQHHQATANRQVKLPDDVPEELRNQLVQSGILGNADVQVINYSENLFKELGELPPEALAAFQAHTNTGGNTKQLDSPDQNASQQQLWSGQEVNLGHTDLGSLLPQGRSLRSVLVVKNSLRPKRGGKQRRVVLLLTSENDVLLFRPKDKSLRRIGDTSNPVIQRVIQLTNHRFDNEEEETAA